MSHEVVQGLPTLPRDQWAHHHNFPEHVLLLGSHQNFRRINEYLVERVADGSDLVSIELTYRRWIAAMRSHEAYEERKLYPYLARRFGVPMSAGEIAEAVRGHEALHDAYDAVIDAFGASDRTRIEQALRAHAKVLDAHLDQEEEMVIPALLELSSEEFWEYYAGSLPELLRKLEARGL